MDFTHTFIDLDETIYPNSSGVWRLIKQRVYNYMQNKFGIPVEAAVDLSRRYVDEYGTTFKGLQAHHTFDPDEYFNFIHDVPLDQHLEYDPALVHALQNIPGEKYILTNGTAPHVRRVLDYLKVTDFFNGIIDIKDMDPFNKPNPEAFEIALKIAGNPDPKKCVFVDDLENNTRGALKMGFISILFGKVGSPGGCTASAMDWAQVEQILMGDSK